MIVLVLNAGSSTVKSHLYRFDGESVVDEPPAPHWEGYVDWTVRADHGVLSASAGDDTFESELSPPPFAERGASASERRSVP